MNTSSPPSPCCMNRAYHGCPDGPVGAREEKCHNCAGTGTVQTKEAGVGHADDLPEFEPCYICGGTRVVHIVGLPVYNKEKALQRRKEGWKAA